MNKFLLSLALIICLNYTANAQRKLAPPEINEQTIVKDSTGKVLPYGYWYPLVASGAYMIRSYSKNQAFQHELRRLSPKEKEKFDKLRAEYLSKQVVKDTINYAKAENGVQTKKLIVKNSYVPDHLPQLSEGFINGEKMAPFKERDIDNKKIDIKALEGKIVVLNFWFIGCPACMQEIPELNAVAAEYANDPNVVFVGICLDKRWDIKTFLKSTPFNFRHIADARYYGDEYKVNLYPTTVVLDTKSVIKFNSVGADNTGYWIKKTIQDIKSNN